MDNKSVVEIEHHALHARRMAFVPSFGNSSNSSSSRAASADTAVAVVSSFFADIFNVDVIHPRAILRVKLSLLKGHAHLFVRSTANGLHVYCRHTRRL